MYLAPRPNFDITDRATYERTKIPANCAKCGEIIGTFDAEPFIIDHGDGDVFTVTDKCGLCAKCYAEFMAKPVRQYKVSPYKVTARYRGQGTGGKAKDFEIIEHDGFAKVW